MKAGRLMVTSFLAAIMAGMAVLLIIQNLVPDANSLNATDAFFTATSAVCVTGLIVHDTGSYFHPLSQLVILVLIQMGGLGMLTFTNFFFILRRRKVGLQGRVELETAHGMFGHVTPVNLLFRIFVYTFTFEFLGAVILSVRFSRDFSTPEAIWQGVFHSVSAFCNAGFSLFATSLMDYRDDIIVNSTMIILIILGGLGFIVFSDLDHFLRQSIKGHLPKLFLHTRAVLVTSGVLLLLGMIVFSVLEYHGHALNGDRWAAFHAGLFLSVTARTAGFNTVDTAMLSNPTLLLLMLFMIVGGSPGSTAGGIKTTTLAVLYAQVLSKFKGRPKTELLGRSIPNTAVSKAIATALVYVVIVICSVIALQFTEGKCMPHIIERSMLLDHMFETISAIATVGLSTGITSSLSIPGKLIISITMFIGRLGPVLIALSLIGQRKPQKFSLPEENINIG